MRFVQVHFQFRESFVQRRDDLRQQIRPHCRDQTYVQRPGHGFALLAGHLLQYFHFAQHGTRLLHQQQTRLGEQHLAAGALEQHHAQLVFQLADLPAQRGLAHMA